MLEDKDITKAADDTSWIACDRWDETLDIDSDFDEFGHHPSVYGIFDNQPDRKFRIIAKTLKKEGSLHQQQIHYELRVETKDSDDGIEEHVIRLDPILSGPLESIGDLFNYLTLLFEEEDIDEQTVAAVTPERLVEFWEQGGPMLDKPILELVARAQHSMWEAEAILPGANRFDHAESYLKLREIMEASYKLGRAVRECELRPFEGDAEAKAREREKNRENGRQGGKKRRTVADEWRVPFIEWAQQLINNWPGGKTLTYEILYDVMCERWPSRPTALKKARNRPEMPELDYFLNCTSIWKRNGLIKFLKK